MKPIILITHKFEDDPIFFGVGKIYSIRANYCQAILQAGGIPVISALAQAEDYAELADGIVFTGSSCDIDPSRYHTESRKAMYCDPVLDEMEFQLFDAFRSRNKPILGICRGMQLINVALGGTLIQDIPEEVPNLTVHEPVYRELTTNHPVYATEGSLFHSLFGSEFMINSYHHQSVKELGKELTATVKTEEGIIEAVEHSSLPIIATQWHPERMIGQEQTDLANMQPLFRHFISLCK